MIKGKPSKLVFPILAIVLCLSLVAMLAPPLSSPVRAGPTQDLGVNILFPIGAAPVTVTPGDRVEVSAEITVASTDYYIVSTTIVDSASDPPVIIGRNTQLTRLFTWNRFFNIKVSIEPGIPGSKYDVIVTADLAVDFDPATSPSDTEEGAVIVGNIQESSHSNQLIGESTLMIGKLILKLASIAGALFDHYEALSDEDEGVVDDPSSADIDRLAGAGGVTGDTQDGVVINTPTIVGGILILLSDLVGFFNT